MRLRQTQLNTRSWNVEYLQTLFTYHVFVHVYLLVVLVLN